MDPDKSSTRSARHRQSFVASNRSSGSTQALHGSYRIRRVTYETQSLDAADSQIDRGEQSQSSRPASGASRKLTSSPESFGGRLSNTSNHRIDHGPDELHSEPAYSNGYSSPLANTNHSSCRRLSSRSSSRDNLIAQCKQAPPDKYKLVCIGFTILGITTLLPWNFFITATDYWMFKFRNVTGEYDVEQPHIGERSPLQIFFESYLAIAANVPMLFSMFINSLYGQRFSQKKRLYVSLSVMLVVFTLTTIFVKINTDQMQITFFTVTMVLVVIISFFSATFQAAIFGIVANFPNNCMHAMVNGQALAGLLAVAIQIVSMINNTGPIMSGLWYFLASTMFLAFAIICYWLMDNDYSRYYLLRIPDEDQLSTSISVNFIESKSDLLKAFEDCWQMALSVVLAFWASLSVFPGVCVLVVPQYPNRSFFTGRFFVPLTTFLLFNMGDLTGRMCSSYLPFPAHRKNALLALTISRAFIPLLILFCNVTPRYYTPVLFQYDAIFPILISLTSLTNGYIFSSAMVMASVSSQRTRLELTGFVMASALGIGLTMGSVSSTILLRFI